MIARVGSPALKDAPQPYVDPLDVLAEIAERNAATDAMNRANLVREQVRGSMRSTAIASDHYDNIDVWSGL